MFYDAPQADISVLLHYWESVLMNECNALISNYSLEVRMFVRSFLFRTHLWTLKFFIIIDSQLDRDVSACVEVLFESNSDVVSFDFCFSGQCAILKFTSKPKDKEISYMWQFLTVAGPISIRLFYNEWQTWVRRLIFLHVGWLNALTLFP